MKVFVAGASGAIGRPLIPRLVAAGHEVTGMTRSEAKRPRDPGGRRRPRRSATSSIARRLERAMSEAEPEVVVHQLTALPEVLDPRKEDTYDETNRLRTEGTRNCCSMRPAASGAKRVVAQSIAFVYAAEGEWVKGEDGDRS